MIHSPAGGAFHTAISGVDPPGPGSPWIAKAPKLPPWIGQAEEKWGLAMNFDEGSKSAVMLGN